MTVAALLPNVFPQFLDEFGDPYAGGSLTFSSSGTDTALSVCSDVGLTVSLGNVITLNDAGRPTSNGATLTSVFLQAAAYRVRLKDAGGSTIWVVDGIYDFVSLSNLVVAPSVQTTTLTGTQHNLALTGSSYVSQVLRCNNASDLTITGFAGLFLDGQRLSVVSVGAGNVYIKHQSGSSTDINRAINLATSTDAVLVAGVGNAEYIYDGTALRWRMVTYEMGGSLAYGPVWAAGINPPSIGNGSLVGSYSIRGRKVSVNLTFTAGSIIDYGTGAWSFTIPIAADTAGFRSGTVVIVDAGTGLFMAIPVLIASTYFSVAMGDGSNNYASVTIPMTWAATDSMFMSLDYDIT